MWKRHIAFAAALVALAGCGRGSDVPDGDAAENIRNLALGFAQYAGTHNGVGPADKKALAKALVDQRGLTEQEAEACFTSPRDGQPYVVRWKQRAAGPDLLNPPIIVYEAEGAGGTRIVADGRPSVRELSEEEFAKAVPAP